MMEMPKPDFQKVLQDAGMPVTEDAVRAEFNRIVTAEGMITNTSRMSPFWRLITALITTPVMWIISALINVVMSNMFVATASGQLLRLLAWGLNITPKPASAALGVIRFTKASAAQVVTVPAGTIVQTERINGTLYQLSVTVDTAIPAGTVSALIPVQATGAAWNLAPGYYRILPVAVTGIASVANEDDWLTTPGGDDESDDELRERCRNQFNLVGNYHTDAVYRSMIAGVAGLSVDRIFFKHDAPRGAGTANAYLLLDSGQASQPFLTAVNDFITTQGHHGHGDDLQCMAMPETQHDLTATVYVVNLTNLTSDEQATLKTGVINLIRCAFRENTDYDVVKTWPYSRFSFSQLGRELHEQFQYVDSVVFSLTDISSDLAVPRLKTLTVSLANA
ncbi:TPA: baseplate J/gp47 family protein [Citrobacter freundii]|uniref:baseplate J/gp47 family protein n=1 Tax=Citrobacter TaxID=544 RepID=UPI000651034A|nr:MULTISPECIES: baseplate J/gp47 family protein [Citrobacter]EJO6490947.1 baseplate J/gp47 family protein [Citrobacter freundii]EKT8684763.1 baseplate J/gp47 family protein [Citrobacter freundii]EKV6333958.1 baseplate J/gp47 family protein [Citrobacter freundii]ELH0169649.1 baseplate J/gp47 family protein [Citrobacter freundii]ELL9554019.1 baseplate J/gp47 family protein [Citrobacter freundii]